MGEYADVGGLKTWYDTAGEGDPLVLLHGGMLTNDSWGQQMPSLAQRFKVIAPERRAHGHTADVEGPLNYEDMATDTVAFLETVVKTPAHLVGFSDGGVVGLLVAMHRPELVRKLVSIGAHPNPGAVLPEAALDVEADDPSLAMFRETYASVSPDGPDHWPVMFAKFKQMVETQPNITRDDLARLAVPTLVVVSDDDMVTLEATIEMYRAIPNSELAVVPGTSHAIPFEKPEVLNRLILDFIDNEPQPMMPFRRAPG